MVTDFRHEWKHEINTSDLIAIRQQLAILAQPDPHAAMGKYTVRSLYFDSPADHALREKINGVNKREKFRLRCYNADTTFIRLEKKIKENGLCRKESVPLDLSDAQKLIAGDRQWMQNSSSPLVQELYSKITLQMLGPKIIVEYTREAFVYPPGNVRVTLDYGIRTGFRCSDFLSPSCLTVPAGSSPILLEVKWDAFLPDIIRHAVQLPGRHTSAFSKYALCRIYG